MDVLENGVDGGLDDLQRTFQLVTTSLGFHGMNLIKQFLGKEIKMTRVQTWDALLDLDNLLNGIISYS